MNITKCFYSHGLIIDEHIAFNMFDKNTNTVCIFQIDKFKIKICLWSWIIYLRYQLWTFEYNMNIYMATYWHILHLSIWNIQW
jgi:hypothetical protein